MANKRTIKGETYNISELVDNAIAFADSNPLNLEKATQSLKYLGHQNPDIEIITRYARESAILDKLARETGANFGNQIGKISFETRESAISGVESYLNRRNAGHRARWSANRK